MLPSNSDDPGGGAILIIHSDSAVFGELINNMFINCTIENSSNPLLRGGAVYLDSFGGFDVLRCCGHACEAPSGSYMLFEDSRPINVNLNTAVACKCAAEGGEGTFFVSVKAEAPLTETNCSGCSGWDGYLCHWERQNVVRVHPTCRRLIATGGNGGPSLNYQAFIRFEQLVLYNNPNIRYDHTEGLIWQASWQSIGEYVNCYFKGNGGWLIGGYESGGGIFRFFHCFLDGEILTNGANVSVFTSNVVTNAQFEVSTVAWEKKSIADKSGCTIFGLYDEGRYTPWSEYPTRSQIGPAPVSRSPSPTRSQSASPAGTKTARETPSITASSTVRATRVETPSPVETRSPFETASPRPLPEPTESRHPGTQPESRTPPPTATQSLFPGTQPETRSPDSTPTPLETAVPATPSPDSANAGAKKKFPVGGIVGIVLGVLVIAAGVVLFMIFRRRRSEAQDDVASGIVGEMETGASAGSEYSGTTSNNLGDTYMEGGEDGFGGGGDEGDGIWA
jgi:hypothetical protein